MRTVTRVLTLIVTSPALSLVAASSALAGAVPPATAKPHGWSLTRMADVIALFSTSGNNTAYYPKTPFQILYAGEQSLRSAGHIVLRTAVLRR